MLVWSIQEVLEATSGQSTFFASQGEHTFEFISTDSREATAGALFVPLVGEQHDGHDHVEAALAAGASGVLWSRRDEPPAGPVIRVADTLQAYQDLGAFHLHRRLRIPAVAVTGSTGKTTTKDLLGCLLATRYRCGKSPGNFNNDVGVPKTLLSFGSDVQLAVMELGMRGRGQIARLARLLQPVAGMITNIGSSHLELLGSREEIARAKGELFQEMGSAGLCVVPHDDDFAALLRSLARGTVCSFSCHPDSQADVHPLRVRSLGLSGWEVEFEPGHLWTFPLPGEHHLIDLAGAWAVARHLGVDPAQAGVALAQVISGLSSGRMEKRALDNGVCLLNDAYNAAPDSMGSALQVLSYAPGRKLAVLGDMLELGLLEEQAHRELGEAVSRLQVDYLLAVGPRARALTEAARQSGLECDWVADAGAAVEPLRAHLRKGDTVLLKASRGVGLDRLVPEVESWNER